MCYLVCIACSKDGIVCNIQYAVYCSPRLVLLDIISSTSCNMLDVLRVQCAMYIVHVIQFMECIL